MQEKSHSGSAYNVEPADKDGHECKGMKGLMWQLIEEMIWIDRVSMSHPSAMRWKSYDAIIRTL